MTIELFGRSPMRTLNASIRGGLDPGQLGVVMAHAGVGKSAFLVHIALGHLLRGTEVLHVSLQDPSTQVRSFYDEILTELSGGSKAGRPAEAMIEVERNRVIYSILTGPFGPDRLTHLLATLEEVMDFSPAVVVIDGRVNAADVNATDWQKLAKNANIRLWVAVQTQRDKGPEVDDLAPQFDTAVVLEPTTNGATLRVLRAGGQDAPETDELRLNSVTMLVEAGSESTVPSLPASPAPITVTLISGGTTGAECAFGEEAEKWGLTEVNLTFDGHRQVRSRGSQTLNAIELKQGAVSMSYVQQCLKRSWDRDGLVAKVLQSQWHLVSRVRQLFMLGVIQEDDTVTGGTGWCVELAKRWNKTVWVYCQERKDWFTWDGSAWTPGEPIIETTQIGGTGTRFVSDDGRAAVAGLFERSFGQG